MPSQFKSRWELLFYAGFAGVLFTFLFNYAMVPIIDPDFGWHLKTGEFMAKNGELLRFDPFTFTAGEEVSSRALIILKGYWLWEITAYVFYSLLGFNGIFFLNFLTLGAMVGVVSLQMRLQKMDYALAILLLTLGFSLLRGNYNLERPQTVSFLFAAILLGFITRVRDGGQFGWALPLVMMIWANFHGGYVVGDLILLCFSAGAVIEYRHDFPRLRQTLCWVAIGIGASLLNPNGISAFVELFTFYGSDMMNRVNEYQSTWIWFVSGKRCLLILWLLIILHGVGIWIARRIYWPELIIFFFLAYFSTAHVRNVGFFAVAMLPVIGSYWQQGLTLRSWRMAPLFKYVIVFMAAASLLWQSNEDWKKRDREGVFSSTLPTKSTRFILDSGLKGRMFNSFDFGGYLILQLYPQHQVFIDGRSLDIDVFNDWLLMTSASLDEVGGRKEFEVLFDRYGIEYVVQPHIYNYSGRLTPLLKFLLVKPEWIPVYVDQQAYILVRNTQLNAAVIARYQMDKGEFNNKMVGYLKTLCKKWPTEVVNQVALAEMLIFVGRYAEAEEHLVAISQLQPDNPHLPALRKQLTVLKTGKRS